MKKFALLLIAIVATLLLSSCNAQIIDTVYKYDNAIIYMPDGSIVYGEVESWRDYDNGDMIQVKIDGTTYYTHAMNVVLIAN